MVHRDLKLENVLLSTADSEDQQFNIKVYELVKSSKRWRKRILEEKGKEEWKERERERERERAESRERERERAERERESREWGVFLVITSFKQKPFLVQAVVGQWYQQKAT